MEAIPAGLGKTLADSGRFSSLKVLREVLKLLALPEAERIRFKCCTAAILRFSCDKSTNSTAHQLLTEVGHAMTSFARGIVPCAVNRWSCYAVRQHLTVCRSTCTMAALLKKRALAEYSQVIQVATSLKNGKSARMIIWTEPMLSNPNSSVSVGTWILTSDNKWIFPWIAAIRWQYLAWYVMKVTRRPQLGMQCLMGMTTWYFSSSFIASHKCHKTMWMYAGKPPKVYIRNYEFPCFASFWSVSEERCWYEPHDVCHMGSVYR